MISRRGPSGGYTLPKRRRQITLGNVVLAIDGPLDYSLTDALPVLTRRGTTPGPAGQPIRQMILKAFLAVRFAPMFVDQTDIAFDNVSKSRTITAVEWPSLQRVQPVVSFHGRAIQKRNAAHLRDGRCAPRWGMSWLLTSAVTPSRSR